MIKLGGKALEIKDKIDHLHEANKFKLELIPSFTAKVEMR